VVEGRVDCEERVNCEERGGMPKQGYSTDSTGRDILRFGWPVRTDGGGVGSEAEKEKNSRTAHT
jgi:hypothetical protein